MLDKFNFQDFEIEPAPQFETPRQFLEYYAPQQDWSVADMFTWENVRNHPGLQTILNKVLMCNTRPLILRKKS